jgi:hypothetical protein
LEKGKRKKSCICSPTAPRSLWRQKKKLSLKRYIFILDVLSGPRSKLQPCFLIVFQCSPARFSRYKKTPSLLHPWKRSRDAFLWSQTCLVLAERHDRIVLPPLSPTAPFSTPPSCFPVVVRGDADETRRAREEEQPSRHQERSRAQGFDGGV